MLGPIGILGMYARRGEVQAAKAASARGVPFIGSTVSLCSLEEVGAACGESIWIQLYVLRDRGFMKHMLERAQAAGITTLVFTVDMPVPGSRYRDARSGIDVLRMLALGARGVMIGRAAAYGLAARGQKGVEHVLDIFAQEMRVAMTLTGVKSISQINSSILAN
jgi:L-lactate dehydrogenase (cytochrome)